MRGDVHLVNIEVQITKGIGIHMVGLADAAVKESLLRIVTALQALDFHIPGNRKIVINLAPADLHKRGLGYDLPIAIGILLASDQISIPDDLLKRCVFYGQLGLDGTIRETGEMIGYAIASEMSKLVVDRPFALVSDTKTAIEAGVCINQTLPYAFNNLPILLRVLQKDLLESLAGTAWIVWNTHKWREIQKGIKEMLITSIYPL